MIGHTGSGSRSDSGFLIQDKAGVELYNTIVQGWPDAGLEFRSEIGPITIDRCAFYENDHECECNFSPCLCNSLFEAPLQNVVATSPVIRDPDDIENADLRGIPDELPPPFDVSADDPWFDPVTYVGAVPPEGEGRDWTHEPWISWWKE